MEDEHVRIKNKIFLYRVKAPFVASGKSILGAIEYDKVRDLLRCHECGDWFSCLARHIRYHGLSGKEYKGKHGLLNKTSLLSEATRKKLSDISSARNYAARFTTPEVLEKRVRAYRYSNHHKHTPENRNSRGQCRAQILKKLKSLADLLGRIPTRYEMREYGISVGSARFIFGSVKKALEIAGLASRQRNRGMRKYSDAQLIELLRNFIRLHGRNPRTSDFNRGFLPPYSQYRNHFGSIKRAIVKSRHRKACLSVHNPV